MHWPHSDLISHGTSHFQIRQMASTVPAAMTHGTLLPTNSGRGPSTGRRALGGMMGGDFDQSRCRLAPKTRSGDYMGGLSTLLFVAAEKYGVISYNITIWLGQNMTSPRVIRGVRGCWACNNTKHSPTFNLLGGMPFISTLPSASARCVQTPCH